MGVAVVVDRNVSFLDFLKFLRTQIIVKSGTEVARLFTIEGNEVSSYFCSSDLI